MTSFLMESVILAFTIGGIVGAIAALQIAHGPVTAKAHDDYERN